MKRHFIFVFAIVFFYDLFGQNIVPKVDVESVRKDVIGYSNYMIPREYIKNLF